MTRNTWTAIVLCFGIWFVYMRWFSPTPPPKTTPVTEPADGVPGKSGATATAGGTATTPAPADALPLAAPLPATLFAANTAARYGFSPTRGELTLVEILKYRTEVKPDAPFLAPVSPDSTVPAGSATFSDETLARIASGPFAVTEEGKTRTFRAAAEGVRIERKYELADDGYWLHSTLRVEIPKTARRDWGEVLLRTGGRALSYEASNPMRAWEVVAMRNDSIERETLEKVTGEEKISQGTLPWVAFGNRYFATVLVNRSTLNPDLWVEQRQHFQGTGMRFPLRAKEGQEFFELRYDVFAGPKSAEAFGGVPGLKKVIDYGFFAWFAFLLLEGMRFFYSFVGNWGVAIIFLTLVVRVVFFPLAVISYRSMKSMQKVQPQLTALREKYKGDAQRMNQEQLALFRANKVNPAGGCLPLLVQLPVFFAMYSLFANSIELFQAPFFGWIHDLSAKDPYYVLPILMGLSMFGQQKLTPTVGMDPMQAKVLLIMPVVFTFVMLNLPSGLTLYIFVSTLLGIAQQLFLNREARQSAPVPVQGGNA